MTKQEIRLALIVGVSVLICNLIGLSAYEYFRPKPVAVATMGLGPGNHMIPTVDASACLADSDKFCAGKDWALPGVGTCLYSHLNDLKPDCLAIMPEMYPHFKPCWKEILKLCHDTPKRDGLVPKCLREKKALVSEACQQSPYFLK